MDLEKLKLGFELTAKKLGKSIKEVNINQYLMYCPKEYRFSERQFGKLGGYAALKLLAIGDGDINSPEIVASKLASIANKARADKVFMEFKDESFQTKLTKAIEKMKVEPLVLNQRETKEFLGKIKSDKDLDREIIGHMSDTHYGLNVNPEEIGNVNSFGWKEAARRTAYYTKELAEYKLSHRGKTKKLHLLYGGDQVAGVIHNLGGLDSELLVYQLCGLYHILHYQISYLLNFFEEIEVHSIAGNHNDHPHRREGGRVVTQKYDSVDAPIYYALSAAFKGRVKFILPKTQYSFIDTLGGRIMMVHGDTLFKSVGNPGRSINIKGLTHEIESFATGEVNKGNPKIEAVLVGHVHIFLQTRTQNGIDLVVNSSLSGTDAYAHSLSINASQASQNIIESTKSHAIGDVRRVSFNPTIDADKSLDKIIPIYDKDLYFK